MNGEPGIERLSLAEIEELVTAVFLANGCDEDNTAALTRTIVAAERDGAESHGLFRVPGYVASLRSGKVDGCASPSLQHIGRAALRVDGARGFAPLALERGIPALARAARETGIAALTLTASSHFAALWHETEMLAEHGLAALACVNYAAVMAPFGGSSALFGTNPISFAWPRPGREPMVFDMATAAMARGEIQIAAREGRAVPAQTGLGPDGSATLDPRAILQGVQLPFGGYKGSALALMVELLAAGATGERFSIDASGDIGDGGPPRGGELLIAISPELLAGPDWARHCETFFERFAAVEGARLPGARRHAARRDDGPRRVNGELLKAVRALGGGAA